MRTLPCSLATLSLLFLLVSNTCADPPRVLIDAPMTPPAWAVMERALFRENVTACREFYARYFDDRGWLECVERWGGDDGPDDAIENLLDWPILHALGADDEILSMYKQAWEGHLRQYTLAKTRDVPFARDGMYYKEFPVKFDWLHNGEGLVVFNLQGLSDPHDAMFGQRVRRYAGFYMNEDPGAANYDPQHKLIRSMINGSRGPLLRKATALDWAGDPIEIENRFRPGHHERNYEEMLLHFQDYNDVVGDHPSNLQATTLALNAYLLTGEEKYKRWLLEYVDAWLARMAANDGLIPSNIGLDGSIGGETEGKWYGGVYGWGFSVIAPHNGQVVHRSNFQNGFQGFMNAYLLTGDDKYLAAWRKQADVVNGNARTVENVTEYPQKYGDDGWYHFTRAPFSPFALERYWLSMREADRKWMPNNAWLAYLEGKLPSYPERSLAASFANIRARAAGMRADTTTPDTRLADDPMKYNPCSVGSLVHLMLGGIEPGKRGSALFCRLRYFDVDRRRAGVPEDVAALVDELSADRVSVTLVNVSQTATRRLLVQAGGYGEHQFTGVTRGDDKLATDDRLLEVTLAPGCGQRLELSMRRFVNQPTMVLPWNR